MKQLSDTVFGETINKLRIEDKRFIGTVFNDKQLNNGLLIGDPEFGSDSEREVLVIRWSNQIIQVDELLFELDDSQHFELVKVFLFEWINRGCPDIDHLE